MINSYRPNSQAHAVDAVVDGQFINPVSSSLFKTEITSISLSRLLDRRHFLTILEKGNSFYIMFEQDLYQKEGIVSPFQDLNDIASGDDFLEKSPELVPFESFLHFVQP